MNTGLIKSVVDLVSSKVLVKESTMCDFTNWLKDGNYDEELDYAEMMERRGNRVLFKDFAMDAFNKFCR